MDLEDLTIGIEEEYQIVDSETGELTSYVSEFLEHGATIFRDQVKPELLQSQIEIGSHVCRNIKEARQELTRLRRMLGKIAEPNGRRIIAAGTHPFSRWQDQIITDKDRYKTLVASMQYIARRLLIFGMHVHIGVPDRELRIDVMNQLAYFMPHVLCLSTSSPFWLGQNTGLRSYRSVVFGDLPRTGLPEYFHSASEYDQFLETLVKTNCIDEPTKIWWDIRPHPRFPTLEIRICDCVTKIEESISIAALLQALVVKLIELRKSNQTWRQYRRSLLAENKWRAIKDGIDGHLVDLGKETEVPVRFLIEELVEFVEDAADRLGTRQELEGVRRILEEGTSADRQLRTHQKTGDLCAVVDRLADETALLGW
ncbi:MAG: carboxylate-amine ligase [Acidobacteriota bacterium]